MSSSHEPPEKDGALSRENKPQVLVRAGKHYVCSSCGTMVEIPADVVGQLVVAVDPSPSTDPPQEPIQSPEPSCSGVSTTPSHNEAVETRSIPSTSTHSLPPQSRPPRPQRPKAPRRDSFTGETIDGLRVPSADELERAIHWVSFHLQILERQGTEVRRLQKLLKQQCADQTSCRRPSEPTQQRADDSPPKQHAHEDVNMTPSNGAEQTDVAHERGPP